MADTAGAQTLAFTRSDIAVGHRPHGVLIGDLNGDRAADVAVSNFASNTLAVLHNTGAGALDPPSFTPIPDGPTDVASADFNQDGRPDLAVTSFGDGRTSILLGRADGRFDLGAAIRIPAPAGLIAEDLDGDGHADMAVVETQTNSLQILRGAGDGTFELAESLATGARPNRVAAGDLNGDGTTDLAVTNLSADSVSVYLNGTSGSFAAAPSVAVGDAPVTPALSDINGDGNLDLLTANIGDGSLSIALGSGTGGFGPAAQRSVGGSPYTLIAADLNADGRQDIGVTRFSANTIAVLLGRGDGSFGNSLVFPTASGPIGIAAGDISGDGYLDLAVSGHFTTHLSVLINRPRLQVAPTSLAFRLAAGEETTRSLPLVLSNHGVPRLKIRSIRIAGPAATYFQLTADGCSGGFLEPGASCTLAVTAHAASLSGRRSASLVIDSTDPSGPTSVPLNLVAYGRFTCRAVGSRLASSERVVANAPNAPCRDDRAAEGEAAVVAPVEAMTEQTPDGQFPTRLRLGDGARSSVSVPAASLTVQGVRIEAVGISARASFLCGLGGQTGGGIRGLTIDGWPVLTDGGQRSISLPGLGTLHVNHTRSVVSSTSSETVRRGLWFESASGDEHDQVVAEARAGRDRGDPCF